MTWKSYGKQSHVVVLKGYMRKFWKTESCTQRLIFNLRRKNQIYYNIQIIADV